MKRLLALLVGLAAFNFALADDRKPYDEGADAKAEISAALQSAAQQNRATLLVFGANWCPDCRVLDLEMHQGELAKLVDARLNVVKINTGRKDRNTDIVAQYGNATKKGIPSVVLLDSAGKIVYQTDGGELADARSMGSEGISKFFVAMLAKARP
jgi:protein disulfide-isomerase